jgi:hypothetical protein
LVQDLVMRPLFPVVSLVILASAPAVSQAASPGDIVSHTPLWVWPLLLYVLTMSLRATRERTAGLGRLLAIPALFIIWGISGLLARQSFTAALGLDWLAALGCGAALAGFVGRPVLLGIDRESRRVTLAGSWAPFVRVTLIFTSKFAIRVAMAVRPDLQEPLSFADAAVSGFSVGYFLTWAMKLYADYTARFSALPMIQR